MLPQRVNVRRLFTADNSGPSPVNEGTDSIREQNGDKGKEEVGPSTLVNTLHSACTTGHLAGLKRLLESGEIGDVNRELCSHHGGANILLTPLCCAASSGNCEAVQLLLDHGADVNRASSGVGTPLHFAVMEDNNVACVATLLSAGSDPNAVDVNGRTPLHLAVASDKNYVTEYVRILMEDKRTDINAQDCKGYTALHLCAANGNHRCTGILLSYGCDVTLKTIEGTTALSMLVRKMPETMNYFVERLDSGITLQSHDPADANCKLKMDFSVLIPPTVKRGYKRSSFGRKFKRKDEEENIQENRRSKETKLLTSLMFTGNKKLLLHPLSEAFLLLKWHRVRKFFLASLFFQMILVALFTIFVMEVYLVRCSYIRHPEKLNKGKGNVSSAKEDHSIMKRSPSPYPYSNVGGFHWFNLNPMKAKIKKASQENVGLPMEDYLPKINSTVPPDDFKNMLTQNCSLNLPLQVIQLLLVVTVVILSLQEIFQLIHKPSKYPFSCVNWVQWLLVASVLITVWTKPKGSTNSTQFQLEYWQYPAAACGILIAWTLTLFQVGRFPSFGVYMEMLGKVTANFGLFILAYACLLIAFALSFCVLFPEHPPFSSVPLSILKVFTMMVGEVDYEELFYNEERSQDPILFPLTTHLLFGAFVLLMTIVLMNLLVGLAVSDIHGLQKGAKLDRLCRQTALIARFESFIFSKKLETVMPTSVIRFIQESTLLTPHSYNPASSVDPKHNELSLCFRPNDQNDRTLPNDIKQAALNLVASASRRQHFHTSSKDGIWNALPSKYLKSNENPQRRKRTSLYSQHYVHAITPSSPQIQNPAEAQFSHMKTYEFSPEYSAISHQSGYPKERLDQMEVKLAVLEKGMDKILEILMTTKNGDLSSTRISRV